MRAATVVLVLAGFGCAHVRSSSGGDRLAELRAGAAAAGLDLPEPLTLTPDMRERAEIAVGRQGSERERIDKLNRFLRARSGGRFVYDTTQTRTAHEAWAEHGGDCLSYAHLFNAMARFLGVSVKYVRYREAEGFEERDGQFVVVTHVASLYADYKVNVLIELTGKPPSWRSSDYQVIGDDEALALHGSNLAMEQLARGEAAEAERVLQFLVERAPDLPELRNNLGVTLIRLKRPQQALAVLEQALERFSDFVPLYVNAAIAARTLGLQGKAEAFAEQARSSWTDPFLPFVRGTWLYEQGKYAAALKLFERATELKPRSVLFLAWLARARLQNGDRAGARAAFAEAVKVNPQHPVLEEFQRQDPALADASPALGPVEETTPGAGQEAM